MKGSKTIKADIIYAVVAAALFVIAGICQYYDSYAPLFWRDVLSVIEHTLFLSLGIVWAVAIGERVVDNKLRIRLIAVAVLLMLLIYFRFLKYNLFAEDSTIRRYLWYGYYIPQCLASVVILLSILGIEKKNGKPISKLWFLTYIPSVVMILLILTNDLHQAVFAFNGGFDNFNSEYTHKAGYYVTMVWIVGVMLFSCGILFYRCRISAVKKKTWLPISLFIAAFVATTLCFIFNSKAFKVPEMLGMTFIVLFESCIQVGLIPSNSNYGKYFDSSNIGALIADPEYNVKYKAGNVIEVEKSLLQEIAEKKLLVMDNTRFCAKPINGGNVFWQEDITAINALTEELSEITEELSADNDLIAAENDLRERQAHIEEQNKLYDEITEKVCPQLMTIEHLLSGLSDTSENYEKNIRLACVYGVYIKRRSNLTIIGKDHPETKLAELSFAIRETLKYLSLSGVSCSYICNSEEKTVSHKAAEIIYDFFEVCVEKALPDLSAVIVNLSAKKDGIYCRVTLGGATDIVDEKQFLNSQSVDNATIDILRQDDCSDYVTLFLPEVCV